MMVRYIIDTNAETIDDLKGFNYDGYQYDANLSKNNFYTVYQYHKCKSAIFKRKWRFLSIITVHRIWSILFCPRLMKTR
jgi:hypothetical protein